MKIGVLGTGTVGRTLGTRLVQLGHYVLMGSREATNQNALDWAALAGERARAGTFAGAAAHGDILFNATAGAHSLHALRAAGAANLAGKVLIDAANPLDFSAGFPPRLTLVNTDSLGERIQREFPLVRVVKALNTVNANVMADPARLPGGHTLPIAGDDPGAKAAAVAILRELGWPAESILDLGGIEAARGTEMYLMLWLRIMQAIGTADFNIKVVRP